MTEKQRQRRVNALARFTIDPDRARSDSKYKERKEQELASLKASLGVQ